MLLSATVSQATLVGPYSVDVNTLHLWHMDTAVPVVDQVAAGTNLVGLLGTATLGNTSYSGYSNALNTVGSGQDSTAQRGPLLTASSGSSPGNVSITLADPASGAFTFEAIVWIGFDPTKNLGATADGGNGRNTALNILTGESGTTANRIFQFRIIPVGMRPLGGANPVTIVPLVTFENIRAGSAGQASIYAAIPTTGPDAILSNN